MCIRDRRCVAHARKIQCNIAEARQWEEGVGVAGVSYSMGNEIIIPDMSAPELGTVFNLNNNCRDYDAERYRSMVAVPIRVGANSVPWGVAVVTTDQPHHFSVQSSDGVPTCEPIRAIAAMAALAVKSLEIGELPSVSAAQKSETGKRSISDGRGRTSDKLIAKN